MNQHYTIVPEPWTSVLTDCDNCGHMHLLTTTDWDGVLIGDECPSCGDYTTRYQRGQEPV